MALLILALLLLIYLPAVHGGPVMDDNTAVYTDKRWVNKNWKALLQPASIAGHRYIRPIYRALTMATYLPLRSFEANHLVNVLCHGLATIVCFHLALALGYDPWIAALIFAVHPLAVESTANVCRRSSILSGIFWGMVATACAWGHFTLGLLLLSVGFWAKEDIFGWVGAIAQHVYIKRDVSGKEMKAAGLDTPLPWSDYVSTSLVTHAKLIPGWFWGVNHNGDHHVKLPTLGQKVFATITLALFFTLAPVHIQLLFLFSPLVGYFFVPISDIVFEYRAYTLTFIFALLWSAVLGDHTYSTWATTLVVAWLAANSAFRAFSFSSQLRFWQAAYRDGSQGKLRVLIMLATSWQLKGDWQKATEYNEYILALYPRQGIAQANIALANMMQAQVAFMQNSETKGLYHIEEAYRRVQLAKEWMPDDPSVDKAYVQIIHAKAQVDAVKAGMAKAG